ncbi:hypothetical protein [Sphingomonas sp. Leaf231]|uniref:hypothetical protein n=1 Tax=Sphingomonas sp. Leaf231 TaxID=1736301 RepID=UPI0012E22579|nr:hypothetical protein [Sphingomonas sp. Leaf231]
MGLPNLKLRGGSYHWRRKIMVAGQPLPLSISLRTGNFYRARLISARLSVAVEGLRMGYGQFSGMSREQMKQVFSDALRWQLQRIEQDQTGSLADAGDHATANSLHAEAWEFLARGGVAAHWTLDEHQRLVANGWSPAQAKIVANIVFDLQNGGTISGAQVATYSAAFGFPVTADNVGRVQRLICKAKAAACREATARLSWPEDESEAWIDEALGDDTPFAFERSRPTAVPEVIMPVPPATAVDDEPTPPLPIRPKKDLVEASEDAIAEHQKAGDWDTDTVKQVRTAIRLFDYACGTGIMIEDLEQSHVRAFTKLCAALPNRWGRTREERAGGLEASLARAATLPASEVGLGQVTINKHLTWVTSVLDHAAGDDGDETGHRPAIPLLFKTARKGKGKGPRKDRKRKRDKRANWTKAEVARLLSAPIWAGTKGIDHRLTPGTEIIHDAWYWLPLMLPLYGGRSSELAGLGLAEVHEQEPIPYFVIDYTEDRPLKNVQSIRKLPIHPELIRLGFIEYIGELRRAGCTMLFPEMVSADSSSFASTFYKTIFSKLRRWAFPEGTEWRRRIGGAWKDKDVHSYRGLATTALKGRVSDSVRCDIFGHEGETETASTYDDEADLQLKFDALALLTPFTAHIEPHLPVRIRPLDRLRHGASWRQSRLKKARFGSTAGVTATGRT